MKKKFGALIIIMSLLTSSLLAGCQAGGASADGVIHLKFGIVNSDTTNYYKGCVAIADEVREATNVKYIKPADNKDIQIRVVIMPDMKDDKPVITTNITIFDKRIKAGEVSSKDMSELEFNKLIYEIQREYGIKKCNLGKSREMQNDFQSAVRSGIRVLQTM